MKSSFTVILRIHIITCSQLGLMVQLVRVLHPYSMGHGFAGIPFKPEFFSGFIYITAMIFLLLNLYSAVQIYEFHIFSFMKSSFTVILRIHIITCSQLGLMVQLVRVLHPYSMGHGFAGIPFKPEFFSGFIYITAMIFLLLNLYSAVQICISYILFMTTAVLKKNRSADGRLITSEPRKFNKLRLLNT